MSYTHINLTSQERMNENDDDVVVVFSLTEAKIKFYLNFAEENLKKLIIPKNQRHSIIAGAYHNYFSIR